MIKRKALIIFLCGIFISCNGKERPASQSTTIPGYALEEPASVYELPDILQEVSGLSYLGSGRLAAVQDEKGILFIYNLTQKKVERKIEFEKKGDFEGVAVIKNDAWVLESNGNLYKIKNFLSEKFSVEKIETDLEKDYDAEGLCYDASSDVLLIACKEAINKDDEDIKTVFGFSLSKEKILDRPVLKIKMKAIKDRLISDELTEFSYNIQKAVKGEEVSDLFMPSAIAIHPVNKNYYLLSSKNKLLISVDSDSNIIDVVAFSEPLMQQPEGITFSEQGTMYISNEGKSGKPNVLEYNYTKP